MSTATCKVTTAAIPLKVDDGEPMMFNVVAEPTSTPGLVVTPETAGDADGSHLTGYWQLTHAPSGYSLPIGEHGGVDVHTARRIGDALSDVGVDWTADKDTLVAQLADKDVRIAVLAAIKRGKYPPATPNTDEDDGEPSIGEDNWPRTAAQATAQRIASSYTRAALQRYADNWKLMRYDRSDKKAMQLHILNIHAMIAEFGMVATLRALSAADPAAADAAARDHWEACDAGDSFGEWLAEWGREYGIPVPEASDFDEMGFAPPPAMSYQAVMNMPLMYPENGTVGSLREIAAQHAYRGEERFGKLIATGCEGPLPPEQVDEVKIAHGCSFYGWSIVALLGWLAKEYPLLAVRAARMVDDIGTNGGNSFCEDIQYPPTGDRAEQTATAAPTTPDPTAAAAD